MVEAKSSESALCYREEERRIFELRSTTIFGVARLFWDISRKGPGPE